MKRPSLLCTAIVILCMTVTACSSQDSSPAKSTSKDSAVTESVDQETAQNEAEADSAVEADTAENSASEDNASEVKSGEGSFRTLSRGFYENSRGWTVRFEPSLFSVEENGDDVKFIYTGESVGENLVEIRYVPGGDPQEVLEEELKKLEEMVAESDGEDDEDEDGENAASDDTSEGIAAEGLTAAAAEIAAEALTDSAAEIAAEGLTDDAAEIAAEEEPEEEEEEGDISIERDEGYFIDDTWCYTATVDYSDDERDVTEVFQSAEYNDGVLITKLKQGVTDENILEGFMGDALWDLVETLSAYQYEPQKQFANVPGTYTRESGSEDAVDTIILRPDHLGSITFQDRIPVYWGSTALTEKNAERSYEYTLDGDTLVLHYDGEDLTFKKSEDQTAEENPYTDPDYVDELNKEINTLYNDGPGKIGRVHKMQAFIMELALHAKAQDPNFKVIVQNAAILGYKDGKIENGEHHFMKDLVDGYSVEGVVGKGTSLEPGYFQEPYVDQAKRGKFVSDTTAVRTEEQLKNYLTRADAWGITPFPKVGGELAQELFPGWRWADNGDYFWVEDPDTLGISDRIDGKRDVLNLSDAKNFLYNINGRPYDNWADWDKEEESFEKGDGDRTRITDSYACGLLVPSEDGKYTPVGEEDDETIADAIEEYGESWDWWWRKEGLDESKGREAWLEALRNSDYDVIYIDSFYNHRARPENQTPLTKEEVESLKTKPDGGRRQVISYLAIGTAEQNRWYCQDDWVWIDPKNKNSTYSMKCGKVKDRGNDTLYIPFVDTAAAKESGNLTEPPVWLAFDYGDEYPEEAVVQWWHEDWRNIIINGGGQYAHKTTGDTTSSIDRILAQGFDGVYLDNADSCVNPEWDAFEAYWIDRGGIPVSD
ncbi:hypothetical protein SAMN04487833_10951 [Sarcina sp. DSM 11001]|uniref:hypothetical protein n=1 Tax=Sarcina sp. DSM 11001 TaxID=1798184 RepID=UPI000885601B|nr:hypothetical protein [Sarcina sp. DSM 11001]SDK90772.1 hypothetical protein SAMN04487833_10951 [Sarcina sp. DSM 11001]